MLARILAVGLSTVITVAAHAQQPPCVAPAPPLIAIEHISALRAQFFARSPAGAFQACDTFAWDFDDGTPIVTQQNPVHEFPSPGRYTIRLTVTNPAGSATAQAFLNIQGTLLPVILEFKAEPARVREGDTVVLSWKTRHTSSIRIDPINYRFTSVTGSIPFRIHSTRQFTLVAIGAAGQTSRTITVTVAPPKRRSVRH